MSVLGHVDTAVKAHHRFVEEQVRRVRSDARFRNQLLQRWKKCHREIATTHTPTGLELPALALPQSDDPGEIARYHFGEGLPGDFPFVTGISRNVSAASDGKP